MEKDPQGGQNRRVYILLRQIKALILIIIIIILSFLFFDIYVSFFIIFSSSPSSAVMSILNFKFFWFEI